jgi:acyl carrier protein
MTESKADVLHRLQAISTELNLTYPIQERDLESSERMKIDSLEFMSLIIEMQREFGIEIPDEDVQKMDLRVLRNLVDHLLATPGSGAASA